jgi:ribosomal protein S27E
MKTLLMIVTLGVAGLLASCQAPASTVPTSAISCTKCGTVYFKSPSLSASSPGGKGFVTLRASSSMTCPDCENKVIAWAKKGEFTEHVCKTCGGSMRHCASH